MAGRFPNLHALVVDDDAFVRSTLRRILKGLGAVAVTEAADGDEGIMKLEYGHTITVVLCDVHMAPTDGLAFLRRLRSLSDRRTSTLPVIMLTADNRVSTLHDAAELDIGGYLLKPVTPALLASRLERIFPSS